RVGSDVGSSRGRGGGRGSVLALGVLADDGDDGQHDERPGSTDPGLVDDQKRRQQLLEK
ncbi:hypothetical protein ACLOJK_028013, partial [Asimina triloba]